MQAAARAYLTMRRTDAGVMRYRKKKDEQWVQRRGRQADIGTIDARISEISADNEAHRYGRGEEMRDEKMRENGEAQI